VKEKKTSSTTGEVEKKTKRKLPILKLVTGISFVLLISFGVFYFVQYQKVNDKYQELSLTADEKNKRTAAKVAKIIDLPKDETPVVVQVNDKDKLIVTKSSSAFFDKSQNNDLVLAYQKANVAVIYRPGENRVIKSDTYQNFFAASNPITVAIIAPNEQQQSLTTQLESKFGNVQIISKNAPKVLNGQSYIVDLTGSNSKTAQDLASQLGMPVGTLPDGESKPSGALFAVVIAPSQ
jgi:cell division protein FtsB